MASNFSIWLRETARLYLRYTAVGLIGIPLALLYAGARRAGWNMAVVSATLLLLGFVSAFMVWRWLGNWQTPSAETAIRTDATSDAWADLVNVALRTTVRHQQMALCFQQSVRADEEALRAWNLLLRSAVGSQAGEHQIRLSHPVEVVKVSETALKDLLAQQTIETEQENYKQSVRTEPGQQRQPAWALALRGQTQNAHGLA